MVLSFFCGMCGRIGNDMPCERKHFGHEKVGTIGQKKMGTHDGWIILHQEEKPQGIHSFQSHSQVRGFLETGRGSQCRASFVFCPSCVACEHLVAYVTPLDTFVTSVAVESCGQCDGSKKETMELPWGVVGSDTLWEAKKARAVCGHLQRQRVVTTLLQFRRRGRWAGSHLQHRRERRGRVMRVSTLSGTRTPFFGKARTDGTCDYNLSESLDALSW